MNQRKFLTISGVSRSMSDWARQPGAVSLNAISERIKRGLDPETAVFGHKSTIYALEINGITDTARGWSRRHGARCSKAIAKRLKAGHAPIDAVFYSHAYAPKPQVSKPADPRWMPQIPKWGGVESLSWRAA